MLAPAGVATGWFDQVTPFQCSATAAGGGGKSGLLAFPTIVQLFRAGQAMPVSCGALAAASGWTDQRTPFQRSTKEDGEQSHGWDCDPTTVQARAELQESGPNPIDAYGRNGFLSSCASGDHLVPFQRTERVPAIPTQRVADVQDTVAKDPSARAPGISNQREPFQALGCEPIFTHDRTLHCSTMTQNRPEVHDALATAERSFRIAHLDPSQVASRNETRPVKVEE